MLKKIPVSQLCMGMYIHELCGSWMDHPFWRSRFLIKHEKQLQQLRESKLAWVWIDTRRGVEAQVAAPGSPPRADAKGRGASAPEASEAPSPERQAFDHARDVCDVSQDRVTQLFEDARLGRKVDLAQIQRLAQDMAESIDEHPDALTSLARIKRADQYTYMHSVAVGALMTALARTLGLSEDQVRLAGMAGLLHDIGKVKISEAILNKPGRLTDAETEIIRAHPVDGAALLREDPDVPPEAVEVCLHHHERYDGKGYPDRLPAGQLSTLVRMASVCDVYDAVTSNRPYKKGWDPAFALSKMLQWEGQFDPAILDAFVRTVGRYPVGAIVSLTQSELGLVVAQNPDTPELPVVKVFYSIRWSHAIPERRVNLAEPDCPSRIMPVAFPVDWAQSGLSLPAIVD